jgi:Fe-S-cluster containining protein
MRTDMEDLKEFCKTFEGTYAVEIISQVEEVYRDLERQSEEFTTCYSIHCPPGCGTCCEKFLPDVTEAEALEAAAYLLFVKNAPELLDKVLTHQTQEDPPCPLYKENTPFHCQIYPARPLICRLFGACANSDKNGAAVFRKCKYNPTDSMPLSLRIDDQRPPEMEDFALRIHSISSEEHQLLPQAISAAVEKIQMMVRQFGLFGPENSIDPDDTPTPLAS